MLQSCCGPPAGGFVSGFLICGGRCKLVVSGGVTRGCVARGAIWRPHRWGVTSQSASSGGVSLDEPLLPASSLTRNTRSAETTQSSGHTIHIITHYLPRQSRHPKAAHHRNKQDHTATPRRLHPSHAFASACGLHGDGRFGWRAPTEVTERPTDRADRGDRHQTRSDRARARSDRARARSDRARARSDKKRAGISDRREFASTERGVAAIAPVGSVGAPPLTGTHGTRDHPRRDHH